MLKINSPGVLHTATCFLVNFQFFCLILSFSEMICINQGKLLAEIITTAYSQ